MRKHRKVGFNLKYPAGYLDKDGYVRGACCFIFKETDTWVAGYLYAHRTSAEFKLGRALRSDECVHHRNRDRTDNYGENLDVILKKDHNTLTVHAMREGLRRVRLAIAS